MIEKAQKDKVISEFKAHQKDTGSTAVQVALLTERINGLTEHFKMHQRDHHSRVGLLQLVSRRRRLLEYLKRENAQRYQEIINKLKLRK